jgi:hypothetical protein
MTFSKLFIGSKILIMAISIVAIILNPKWWPIVLSINIALAVLEAAHHKFYINALIGMLLVVSAMVLKHNESLQYVILYMSIYCIWNIWFHMLHHPDWYSAIPHNIVPYIATLLVIYTNQIGANGVMWNFVLFRLLVLLPLAIHVANPKSCHAH